MAAAVCRSSGSKGHQSMSFTFAVCEYSILKSCASINTFVHSFTQVPHIQAAEPKTDCRNCKGILTKHKQGFTGGRWWVGACFIS